MLAQDIFSLMPSTEQAHKLDNENFYTILSEIRSALRALVTKKDKQEVLLRAKTHPIWQIRLEVLEIAMQWAEELKEAKEYIFSMTHDSVDTLAFHAITRAGQLKDLNAIKDLTRISGWPSQFLRSDAKRKPVGIGAALTKRAIVNLFGTSEFEKIVEQENKFIEPFRKLLAKNKVEADLSNMVRIPAGKFILGTHERDDLRFYCEDYIPLTEMYLPEFYIDKYPVSNKEYRKFLQDISEKGHKHCHHDEPCDKDHTPSHWRDERFNDDDHPVVGIDWYDAYAYAKWAGKRLPTEEEWEKAARGSDGRQYPWGNEFDVSACRYMESTFDTEINTLEEWEEMLRTYTNTYPLQTVLKNGSIEKCASPYGVMDMVGNVWEWTNTNYFSRKNMDPFFKGRESYEYMNRPAAFPVIRGGCFTSLPDTVTTFHRGKDLMTDRHCEIGFRCAV